jgi:hypothetical protein
MYVRVYFYVLLECACSSFLHYAYNHVGYYVRDSAVLTLFSNVGTCKSKNNSIYFYNHNYNYIR